MKIIIFTHPLFLGSQSMPRYATMLEQGMLERGHAVGLWTASPFFFRLPVPVLFKKWLGYIDQFIVFPFQINRRLKNLPQNTLFVFSDQALGPWVPLAANRLHVIHCHDFLAQQSAKGIIPENRVGWSGIKYQEFIRKGYKKGKNFISISKQTQTDLHDFMGTVPALSKVVYNGLNQKFEQSNPELIRAQLTNDLKINLSLGYILHVGGNQFYKNRKGVIEIYTAWRKSTEINLPLLLVGSHPTMELEQLREESLFASDIHFLTSINDDLLKQGYQGATVLLFPSLAEGFGWPIAEAMASGCPVITTNEAPMTEVGGQAAYYIDKRPLDTKEVEEWAKRSALILNNVIRLNNKERQQCIDFGIENSKRFETEKALDQIESIYKKITENKF
ncbi:glycosyltransferase family 1 protein [Flavobacterium ovatum]|uniref:glycosyltransferase family 4 protein n=1 Tax=Flavobacterium ovatum TaxID=1928857 RepID=UPI00344E2E86